MSLLLVSAEFHSWIWTPFSGAFPCCQKNISWGNTKLPLCACLGQWPKNGNGFLATLQRFGHYYRHAGIVHSWQHGWVIFHSCTRCIHLCVDVVSQWQKKTPQKFRISFEPILRKPASLTTTVSLYCHSCLTLPAVVFSSLWWWMMTVDTTVGVGVGVRLISCVSNRWGEQKHRFTQHNTCSTCSTQGREPKLIHQSHIVGFFFFLSYG